MDKKLNKAAQELAKHGRYGDDSILHVSKAELAGLASLHPEGKLPTNPKTGQPEAFFFLPFLAAMGAAAPAAAATTAALGTTAAAAPALAAAALPAAATTAGTAAGTAAALGSGAAGTALTAPAATAAGLGSFAAPSAVTAAPLVTSPTAASALTGAGAMTAPASTASGIASLGQPASALGAAAPASFANPAGATAAGLSGAFPAAPAAAGAASSGGGLGGLLGGMDTSKMLQYGAMAAMMMPQGGGGDEEDDGSNKDVGQKNYDRGDTASAPDGGAQGGTTREFNYFPHSRYYAEGGLVKSPSHLSVKYDDDSVGAFTENTENYDKATENVDRLMMDRAMKRAQALQDDRNNDDRATRSMFADQFSYAEGGLASLDAPQADPAQMGGVSDPGQDQQLIEATVAALKGQAPNADQIIQMFVQTFGQDALKHLIQTVQQGGQSDGLSDSVPASISNGQTQAPAKLSEGEYVVPADVVSHLGNGATTAGARHLDNMVDRTRQMRGAAQPQAIDPNQALPA